MTRRLMVLAGTALVAVLLLSVVWGGVPREAKGATTAKPNFVFILADDMRKDDLKYMPKTRSLLKGKGKTFENAFVSSALCCPSRATIMRGQYAHNTHVWTNSAASGGGWRAYTNRGYQKRNVATRLAGAGYSTGLFGKYLNGYKGSTVPAGWDDWFAKSGNGGGGYFDYDINDNGTIKHLGSDSSDYSTDVISEETRQFIDASAAKGEPFFAYVTPHAPHHPATPAPRDLHAYDGLRASRVPSFDETDVSDKPPWIRGLPRLSGADKAEIDNLHEKRAESLQAVDDLVGAVVRKLSNTGQLANTYVFFTSDNGWHEGEHRILREKWRPYEEDIHMPLLVRGPGVAAGSTSRKLVINTDYFPTFTDLAGIQTPSYADGRSLRRVLEGDAGTWRRSILLEAARNTVYRPRSPAYHAVRTSTRKYVRYGVGARELYDLTHDPYEQRDSYRSASPPADLASRLRALEDCARRGCRAAENRR